MKRFLIVDDHEVVREGFKRIIDEYSNSVVFGEASTASEAIHLAHSQEWDMAVLDLSLAGKSGLEVLKEIKQIRPKLPVLILSMHSEEQYARRVFKSGAAGYITKDSPRAELLRAIHKVLAGGKYLSPTLAENLVTDLERGSDRAPHEGLSDREFQVMRLIASGCTVSQIGEMLSLSAKTISTYRSRILEKTGMRTNAELTHYVISNKLSD